MYKRKATYWKASDLGRERRRRRLVVLVTGLLGLGALVVGIGRRALQPAHEAAQTPADSRHDRRDLPTDLRTDKASRDTAPIPEGVERGLKRIAAIKLFKAQQGRRCRWEYGAELKQDAARPDVSAQSGTVKVYYRTWLIDRERGVTRIHKDWSTEAFDEAILKNGKEYELAIEASTAPEQYGPERRYKVAAFSVGADPLDLVGFEVVNLDNSALIPGPTGTYALTKEASVKVRNFSVTGSNYTIYVNGNQVAGGEYILSGLREGKNKVVVRVENTEKQSDEAWQTVWKDTTPAEWNLDAPETLVSAPLPFLYLNNKPDNPDNDDLAADPDLPRRLYNKGAFIVSSRLTDAASTVKTFSWQVHEADALAKDDQFPYPNYAAYTNPTNMALRAQGSVSFVESQSVVVATPAIAATLGDNDDDRVYRLRLTFADALNNSANKDIWFKVDTTGPELLALYSNHWTHTPYNDEAGYLHDIKPGPLVGFSADADCVRAFQGSQSLVRVGRSEAHNPNPSPWMLSSPITLSLHSSSPTTVSQGTWTMEDFAGNISQQPAFDAYHENAFAGHYREWVRPPEEDPPQDSSLKYHYVKLADDQVDESEPLQPDHFYPPEGVNGEFKVTGIKFNANPYLVRPPSWNRSRSVTTEFEESVPYNHPFVYPPVLHYFSPSGFIRGAGNLVEWSWPSTQTPMQRSLCFWLQAIPEGPLASGYHRSEAEPGLNPLTHAYHWHEDPFDFFPPNEYVNSFEFVSTQTAPRRVNVLSVAPDALSAGESLRLLVHGYFGPDLKPGDPVTVQISQGSIVLGGQTITGQGSIEVLPLNANLEEDPSQPAGTARVVLTDLRNATVKQSIEVLVRASWDALGVFDIQVSGENVVDLATGTAATYEMEAVLAVKRLRLLVDANHDAQIDGADAAAAQTRHGVVMAAGFGKANHPDLGDKIKVKIDAPSEQFYYWMDPFPRSILKRRGVLTLRSRNPLVRFYKKETDGTYTALSDQELTWSLEDTNYDQADHFDFWGLPPHKRITPSLGLEEEVHCTGDCYLCPFHPAFPRYESIPLTDHLQWVINRFEEGPEIIGSAIPDLYVDAVADTESDLELVYSTGVIKAFPDSFSVETDGELTVEDPGILWNDTAVSPATIVDGMVTFPQHGFGDVNVGTTRGDFFYIPNPGFTGVDTFQYRLNGPGMENFESIATVSIFVGTSGTILTAPKANDVWRVGSVMPIVWSDPGVAEVRLQISRDNAQTWENLHNDPIPAGQGQFSWLVDGSTADACLIRILSGDGFTVLDYANGLFRIVDDTSPQVTHRSTVRLARLSNGLGADSLAGHTEAVPGLGSVNVINGNLHLSEFVRSYQTPAQAPDVQVFWNSLDALGGLGRNSGWRTNYHLRLWDTSVDTDQDGDVDPTERADGDLLVLKAADGSYTLFYYDLATKTFKADPQGRLVAAELGCDPVDASGSYLNGFDPGPNAKGWHYKLNLHSNAFFYFDKAGYLVRIENLRGKGLTVARGSDGQIEFVDDDYGRFEPLTLASFGAGNLGSTLTELSGREATGWAFEYEAGSDGVHRRITKVSAGSLFAYEIEYSHPSEGKVVKIRLPEEFQKTITYTPNASAEPRAPSTAATVELKGGSTPLGSTEYASIDPALDFVANVKAGVGNPTDPDGIETVSALKAGYRLPETITTGRKSVTLAWDAKGNLISRSETGGVSVSSVYDNFGIPGANLLESTTRAGAGGSTVYTYFASGAARGLPQTIKDPCDNVTTFAYGAVDNESSFEFLKQTTDANGKNWVVSKRNAFGQPTLTFPPTNAIKDPAGRKLERTYGPTGLPASETDLFGFTIAYGYDGRFRRISTTRPGGAVQSATLDALGNPTLASDWVGNTTATVFDGLSRPTKVTSRDKNGSQEIADLNIEYLVTGDGVQEKRWRGAIGSGRLLSIAQLDFLGRTWKSYVPFALTPGSITPSTLEAAAAYATVHTYSSSEGWLEKTTVPVMGDTLYEYRNDGRIEKVTAPGEAVSRTVYHPTGWVAAQYSPGHGEWAEIRTSQTIYDACGRPLQSFTATDDQTVTAYRPTGEVFTVLDSDGKGETFAYDDDGVRVKTTDLLGNEARVAYELSSEGMRIVRESWLKNEGALFLSETVTDTLDGCAFVESSASSLTGTTTFEHEANGLTKGYTPPGFGAGAGQTAFSVSRDGLLRTQATSSPFGGTGASFDPNTGDLTGSTDRRQLATANEIEPATGDMKFVTDTLTPASAEGSDYNRNVEILQRDASGTVVKFKDASSVTWTVTPDYAARKMTASGDNGTTRVVNYFKSGLVEKVKINALPPTTYAYNKLGQQTLVTDGSLRTVTSVYDAKGRLKEQTIGGFTTKWTYNDKYQLVSVEKPGGRVTSYEYRDWGAPEAVTSPKHQGTGIKTLYTYDAFARPTGVIYADGKSETVTLFQDAADGGRPLKMADRAGRVHETVYGVESGQTHKRGLPTEKKIWSAGEANLLATIGMGWNGPGDLETTSISGAGVGGSTTASFDARGRPASISHTGPSSSPRTTAWTYRNDNRPKEKLFGGKKLTVNYGHNPGAGDSSHGRMTGFDATDEQGGNAWGSLVLGLDSEGLPQDYLLPHGVDRTITARDGAQRPVKFEQFVNGVTTEYTIVRNSAAQITRIEGRVNNVLDHVYEYDYDAGMRLKLDRRVGSHPYQHTFTYDLNDNRIEATTWAGFAEMVEEESFAGPGLPSKLTALAGTWQLASGELEARVEAGAWQARAAWDLATGSDNTYSVQVRAETAGMAVDEQRFAGLTLGGNANGRYVCGLEILASDDGQGGVDLSRRLKLAWLPVNGTAETLAANQYVAYAGETLTLHVASSPEQAQAWFEEDGEALGIVASLEETIASGFGLEAYGTRVPVIDELSADPNPAYLAGGGGGGGQQQSSEGGASSASAMSEPAGGAGPASGRLKAGAQAELGVAGPLAWFDNLSTRTVSGTPVTKTYTYNDLDQLTAIDAPGSADDETFHYNDLGLMYRHEKGGVVFREYSHDVLKRVKTIIPAAGPVVEFEYAGASWIRTKTIVGGAETTEYHFDGFACVSQTTGSQTTYYAALGQMPMWEATGATPSVSTYTLDGLGNVTGLWSGSSYAAQYTFDAHGERKVVSGAASHASTPGYRGQLHDEETGDIYLRNRNYQPGLGRYRDIDPIGLDGGLNMYGYCAGDPVNCWDPMGLEWYRTGNGGHVWKPGPGEGPVPMEEDEIRLAEKLGVEFTRFQTYYDLDEKGYLSATPHRIYFGSEAELARYEASVAAHNSAVSDAYLAEAHARRDARRLWVIYVDGKYWRSGVNPDEESAARRAAFEKELVWGSFNPNLRDYKHFNAYSGAVASQTNDVLNAYKEVYKEVAISIAMDKGAGLVVKGLKWGYGALTKVDDLGRGAQAAAKARRTQVAGMGDDVAERVAPSLRSDLMDPSEMARVEAVLTQKGIKVERGTAAARQKLAQYGAEGLYDPNAKTIFLDASPSKSAFWEESYHAMQHILGKPRTGIKNGIAIDLWEEEVKVWLFKNRHRLGIPNSQGRETIQHLRDVRLGNYP